MVRRALILALAALLAPESGDVPQRGRARAWPAPPFDAWVLAGGANVHLRPEAKSPEVGILGYGDPVRVTGCVPDCARPGAWAILEGPGAVKLDLLAPPPESATAVARGATARYLYGRLLHDGRAYARPDRGSRVVERHKVGNDLAFRDDPALRAAGWLERPAGGFVRLADVRLHRPSAFAGEHDPPPLLAFVRREAVLVQSDGTSRAVHRYERFPALALLYGGRVTVPGGTLLRSDVRIAERRARPAGVPAGARWVHVDLDEQALTAYEGDTLVFATLVATGKVDHRTKQGLFPVFYKSIHASMHGDDPGERYFVDEVPWIQFFQKGMALHGTFWHDAFGRTFSHGCVNLSFADAKWLFDWAPPRLPPGWHAIEPLDAGIPTLWVKVEHARPVVPSRKPAAPPQIQSSGGPSAMLEAAPAPEEPFEESFEDQPAEPPAR